MSRKTRTRTRSRPVEEVFNGVMEELRALRADVERLQADRAKEQSSASTAVSETMNDGQEPSTSTGRQGLSNSAPASGSSSEPRERDPLPPLQHDTRLPGGHVANLASPVEAPLTNPGPSTAPSSSRGIHAPHPFAQGGTSRPSPWGPLPQAHATTATNATTQEISDYSAVFASHNPAMELEPVPASALPDVDIVPLNVKKDIWRGKDVNLAVLLLPLKDRKYAASDREFQIGGEVFSLKGKIDNRLTRDLTISEFITAFNIYKRVLCSRFPNRLNELDKYLSFIIDISAKFPGFCFYQYHVQFSAKAAEYLEQNIRVDWGSLDSVLLNTIVAGQKANACSLCQAIDHTAHFCGLNADRTPTPRTTQARYGNKGPCRYFQKGTCFKNPCPYDHVCADCRSKTHRAGQPSCPKGEHK